MTCVAPILTGDKTYKTIFTLVERMEGRAQERSEVLEQFSRALREDYGGGDDAGLSITMIIRKHNAILYASAGAPMGVKNTRLGKIERIHSDGRSWTSHAKIREFRRGGDAGDACSGVEFLYLPQLAWLLHHAAAGVYSFSAVSRMAVNPHCYAPVEQRRE